MSVACGSESLGRREGTGDAAAESLGLSIPSRYLWEQSCQYNVLLYLFIFGTD